MKITLTPAEVALAYWIAANRETVNEAVGVREARRDGRTDSPMNLHILGAVAEVAFAKWRNVFPDLSAHPRNGTCDFTMNGSRIDIKGRPRPALGADRGLVVSIKKKVTDVDVYVLGFVDADTVDFVGWAWSQEVINDANIRDLGFGPSYVLERPGLHPFSDRPEPSPVPAA